jgi:hypothetical protein
MPGLMIISDYLASRYILTRVKIIVINQRYLFKSLKKAATCLPSDLSLFLIGLIIKYCFLLKN